MAVASALEWLSPRWPGLHWLHVSTVVCVTATSGCTSVISSAYLREAWLDAVEHAADAKSEAGNKSAAALKKPGKGIDVGSEEDDSRNDSTVEDDDPVDTASADADEGALSGWSPATLDEAIRGADERLASSGGLNAAARSALVATLEATPRQDWPVVVEEFTGALAAAHAAAHAAVHATAPTAPAATTAIVSDPPAPPPMPPVAPPVSEAEASPQEPDAPKPEPVQASFAIQNACFASKVRAWGVVDRFETAEFEPGQEVIVYFELDQLASRESADGHTTRIDTVLALVDGDGRRVHEWTFEPLEETCRSRRRDYFARYLVTMPASMPRGACRLDIAVTDTVAGRSARAALPLQVLSR